MESKSLVNQLKLAYSPLSNYDFSILKGDRDIQNALQNSSLYIIAQRPVLSFENIRINKVEGQLEFEIHQQDNNAILKCKLPIFQENLVNNSDRSHVYYFGSHDPQFIFDENNVSNVHGIKIYKSSIEPENFIIWFSPEKFLFNYLNGHFSCFIDGDVSLLLKYNVHYVGQSTDQDIWKRLTGHEKLQQILSVEYPFVYGTLPTHEIALLLFEFSDNISFQTFDGDAIYDDFMKSFSGEYDVDQRAIYLDAEKALVKAMTPKHNKILFKNYPKSTDGLHKYKLSSYSYSFMDPITFKYGNDEIRGGLNEFGGDIIFIDSDSNFTLNKA
ncbi:hypothetical protein [Sphingobacterium sp. R2]|uniref:hypothetical protein n=1 Tax=Sphingobacterium sp. R2 TaxID=3112958 RepID=UPI00345CC46A